jgi:hypothetical protein
VSCAEALASTVCTAVLSPLCNCRSERLCKALQTRQSPRDTGMGEEEDDVKGIVKEKGSSWHAWKRAMGNDRPEVLRIRHLVRTRAGCWRAGRICRDQRRQGRDDERVPSTALLNGHSPHGQLPGSPVASYTIYHACDTVPFLDHTLNAFNNPKNNAATAKLW